MVAVARRGIQDSTDMAARGEDREDRVRKNPAALDVIRMTSATDELLNLPPYGLPQDVKAAALMAAIREQVVHHDEHCPLYARWLRHQGFNPHDPIYHPQDVPYLP